MNPKLRAGLGVLSLAVLMLFWGCRGDVSSPGNAGDGPEGLLVSSPFAAAGHSSTVSASRGSGSVAYVSVVPGSVPGGATLSVRNLAGGATATTVMMDGGADPVEIDAADGNDLSIIVTDSNGNSTTSTEAVRQRRPPRVVRTKPIRGSTDVPLNVRVAVVFSGPIDSTTVSGDALVVLQAGKPVPGAATLSADGLTLSWTASSSLAVATSYMVVLSQTIEDRNGFPVAGFEPVDFTTGASLESDYGALQIIVRTSGTPAKVITDPVLPTSGWQIQVGAMTPFSVNPEDTITVARLPGGRYDLTWNISPNCSANAATPAQAIVTAGVTSHVAAIFTCSPWAAQLQATMVSSGQSVPSEHQLIFRSAGYLKVLSASVPANGKALIPLPESGKLYMATLTSSNDQCFMNPRNQEVTAGPDGIVVVQFKVTCGEPTARNAMIEIITRTSGTPVTSELWEPSPMIVRVEREGRQGSFIVSPNATLYVEEYSTLNYLIAGEHRLVWESLPPNCVAGPAPDPFQVVDDEVSHVTVTAACAAWPGRLQINTTLIGPNYGALPIHIAGGGLPVGAYPISYITPGRGGSVPIPRGEYDVWVDTSYLPCDVGENPRHVTVADFGAVLNIAVTCEGYGQ